ncbi:unnamed protein product [Penicillium nalgiovense]|nr:unnamed protein product [Penicillium nalgiovense]CAG8114742.1 unnamed protein product [Penicillium nalgiovense]
MPLRGALLTQGLGCGELGNAAVSCRELGNAAVSCRELGNAAVSCRELVNAAVSCGSHLSSQRPPAEFTCLTSLGSWQRQPWSRKLSSPQAKEGHYDASKCEDRSPDFFGLGIRLLLYFFGYVSTKEPVAQMVARTTVSLLALKTSEQR